MKNKRQLAIALLFFVSGAVGLAYEVVWVRQMSLLLGVSIYAVSAVLVAFMGGLGIGAEVFGRTLDRGISPIRLYASLEIGLGVYVLFFPEIYTLLEKVYLSAHGGAEGATFYVISLRFTLAVLALVIPTTLMGGTLPSIVRYFAASSDKGRYGGLAGALYAVNTIGAMTGCVLAGFALIETLGLTGTMHAGAVANILAGTAAWLIAGEKGWTVTSPDNPEKTGGKEPSTPSNTSLYILYGISGFCALALEVLWTRLLILLLNNTTYAFSLILSVFLLGIGFGSAVVSAGPTRTRERSVGLFAMFQVGVGVMAIGSLAGMAINRSIINALNHSIDAGGAIAQSLPGGESMVSALMFSLFVVTPCTFIMGAAFPMAMDAVSSGKEKVGGEVGRLYAMNIAGCVAGSVMAGYMLIPAFGIQNSIIAVAWVSVLSGLWLIVTRAREMGRKGMILAFAICVPMTISFAIKSDIVYVLSAQKLDEGSVIEFYEEGPSATVLISSQETDLSAGRKPVKRLWINGDPIAGAFREALQLERLQAHIPLLLHKNPKTALVICFGTGSTAGAALTHELDSVTAVDISREVFDAGHGFAEGNLDVMNSSKLRIVEEDGRNYLLTTKNKFDFITSEPPPPSNAGIVSLYTKEYYQICKKRLNKGGIISQWIPLHHLSDEDIRSLVASFASVFPKAAMWYTKWDAMMIGAAEEIPIDLERIKKGMEKPGVLSSLDGIGITDEFQIAATYMMGPKQISEYVDGIEPLTDDKPRVEFTAPRVHARGVIIKGENLDKILEHRTMPAVVNASKEDVAKLEKYFRSETIFYQAQVELNDANKRAAAKLFRKALQVNPDNQDAGYAYIMLNLQTLYAALDGGRADLGLEMLEATQKLDTRGSFRPQFRFLRGMFLANAGKMVEAGVELSAAVKLDENYFMAIVNLAGLYGTQLGQPEKAKQLYNKALKLTSSRYERQALIDALNRLAL